MRERRLKWELLRPETKTFVEKYLNEVLGLKTEKEVEAFLFPDFEKETRVKGKMKDLQKAGKRVLQAIEKGEKICIYGDYDCDGVPGVAMCKDFFEKINYANVIYYIPHRHNEGYGLHKNAINKLNEEGVRLIITLDLGVTNIEEVDHTNTLEIDVIITDHHLPIILNGEENLPQAFGIINNKQVDCKYEDKNLCGTGTTWKLICEIIKIGKETENVYFKNIQVGYEKWLLDLVAIATIADMVPLVGENRALTIFGLHVLTKTKREGLKQLLQNAKVDLKNIGEVDIAFSIAPRINSASRMDHPLTALKVLSSDLKEGIDGANILENLNLDRKENVASIVKKVYKEIDKRIKDSSDRKLPEVLVVGSKDFNIGVVGIVAMNIVEKYNVNAFVWGVGEDKNILKGSVRGRGDTHVVELMTICKETFLHFGGHEMSGGFAVEENKIHELENILNKNWTQAKIAANILESRNDKKRKPIQINLSKINSDFFNGLNLIGPFGAGNEKPIFEIVDIAEKKFERFGKKKEHLKVILTNGKICREAVKFFVDEKLEKEIEDKFLSSEKCEIFFEIEGGYRTNIPRLKLII